MPSSRREQVYRVRQRTVADGREVTGHAPGHLGQTLLNGPVQNLADIVEVAGNLNDNHLTCDVCPDLPRGCGRVVGVMGCEWGDAAVEKTRGNEAGFALTLRHGVLVSVALTD
jgi:hypothetical protein